MNDEKKIHRRKLVMRYLLLAAAILVIAAVTVISVFAANDWFRADSPNINIDNGDDDSADGDTNGADDTAGTGDDSAATNDDGDTADSGDDTPAATETTWLTPVATVSVLNAYDFIEDVTLMNSWHMHEGIDFEAEVGTAVMCCMDGTVESITLGDQLDGNTVTISHADGTKTIYSYIDVAEDLTTGQSVKRGQTIGTVSEATGAECLLNPHLHFAVEKSGELCNPEEFLEIDEK